MIDWNPRTARQSFAIRWQIVNRPKLHTLGDFNQPHSTAAANNQRNKVLRWRWEEREAVSFVLCAEWNYWHFDELKSIYSNWIKSFCCCCWWSGNCLMIIAHFLICRIDSFVVWPEIVPRPNASQPTKLFLRWFSFLPVALLLPLIQNCRVHLLWVAGGFVYKTVINLKIHTNSYCTFIECPLLWSSSSSPTHDRFAMLLWYEWGSGGRDDLDLPSNYQR